MEKVACPLCLCPLCLRQEVTPQGIVAYAYDDIGRRTSMTVNGQTPVGYQYDAVSRLTQVAQGIQVVGLSYDADGRRTTLTYPNGVTTSYGYDTASRLTSILHQGPSAVIESLTYTYDAAGNRISFDRAGGTATSLPDAVQAAYDAANEQIQFNNATPNLTYDANGNLTSQTDANGTTTYSWDARNRLTAISGPGVSASFVYDLLGRRTSKTINGTTTHYHYDGNDIVQEIGGGAVSAIYLHSLDIDEPFVRQSSSNEYYHTDSLGSVLALTDQTGSVQTIYRYDPFGNISTSGATSTNPFQYTGRENDGIGLYYYRARYYAPSLSRFTNQDPTGLGGGVNVYAYVLNNPLLFNDPFGLRATCVFTQNQGRLICTCNGAVIVDKKTYSGYGPGENNPFYEGVKDIGPIPQGIWEIREMVPKSPGGRLTDALPLVPRPGNNIFKTKRDRNDFFIHGPKQGEPQSSSKGCIILELADRKKINDCDGEKFLIVVPNSVPGEPFSTWR